MNNPSSSLDFDGARLKHFRFKSKLRAILYGSDQDRTTLLDHHACSLGQWIEHELLPTLGHLPQAVAFDHLHIELHEQAREVLRLLDAGQAEEAHQLLPAVDHNGEQLLVLLTEIQEATER